MATFKSEITSQRHEILKKRLAENLRRYWLKNTQSGFAETIAQECGISLSLVRKTLRGERLPSLDLFLTLCSKLDLDPSDLVGLSVSTHREKERQEAKIASRLLENLQACLRGYQKDAHAIWVDEEGLGGSMSYAKFMSRQTADRLRGLDTGFVERSLVD